MVRFRFHEPMPTHTVQATQKANIPRHITDRMKVMTQDREGAVSVGRQMSSVI